MDILRTKIGFFKLFSGLLKICQKLLRTVCFFMTDGVFRWKVSIRLWEPWYDPWSAACPRKKRRLLYSIFHTTFNKSSWTSAHPLLAGCWLCRSRYIAIWGLSSVKARIGFDRRHVQRLSGHFHADRSMELWIPGSGDPCSCTTLWSDHRSVTVGPGRECAGVSLHGCMSCLGSQ